MMVEPLISIIIVNFNGKYYLEKCLKSVYNITYKQFEIILVDNNSTDNSLEFVKANYPSTIIIKLDKNYGFAGPNNIGSKIAKGDFFLFLNNDTIVEPNFISEMINVAKKDSKIGICQSLLLKPNGDIDSSGDFIDELGVVYNSKTKVNNIREISSARGASMLIRKDIFKILNGFDEKFFVSFEDVDISWRTWILGYKILLIPKSIVFHTGGQTIRKIKDKIAFHGFKNQLSMKITNFESKLALKKLFLFFIVYGFREFRIWLDYTIKGSTNFHPTDYEDEIAQKPNMKIILHSIFWIIGNPRYLWKKHLQVNSSRKLSTKTLQEMNILSNQKQ